MERMEHILEIAKALAKNPELFRGSYPEDRIAEIATKVYDNIEILELKRLNTKVK